METYILVLSYKRTYNKFNEHNFFLLYIPL